MYIYIEEPIKATENELARNYIEVRTILKCIGFITEVKRDRISADYIMN